MPLPLLIPIAIGVAGAIFGAGKTVKAVMDSNEADDINANANEMMENAKASLEKAKNECSTSLENLGLKKAYVLDNVVQDFIFNFEKLKNVNFKNTVGTDELNSFIADKTSFKNIKELSILADTILKGVGGGLATGAVIAFGAYGAVGMFGAASTGTAIATLSGTVATNATLAFLGGGAIAAGGLGVAGGLAVLGGIVAVPALCVIGLVSGSKASAKLDDAKKNLAEVKKTVEELKNMEIMASAISRRSQMFYRLLVKLDAYLTPLVYDMKKIIETNGTDFENFIEKDQQIIAKATSFTKAIKTVLDTPIINAEGGITEESLIVANNTNKYLE